MKRILLLLTALVLLLVGVGQTWAGMFTYTVSGTLTFDSTINGTSANTFRTVTCQYIPNSEGLPYLKTPPTRKTP